MTRVLKLVFLTLVLQGTPNYAEFIKEEAPPFICIDGSEISLTNVCDGLPHCADSSDETTKLCHHVVCPVATFRCAYGACIARSGRCNGFVDCVDGSDELYCDDDSDCRDQKFRCPTSSECISSAHVCDGIQDCAGGGDENAEICRDYVCPEHAFQCSYGGCVHQEVVCDGIKDCIDATDETESMCAAANCKAEDCERYACGYDEFSCENVRQCIPLSRLCDGTHQCRDASDEKSETCKSRSCPEGHFRCEYGACVPESSRCNGQANCHDWSDEDEKTCGVAALPAGACRLPAATPGTHYAVKGNCERCRPGHAVPEFTRLDYGCHGNASQLEGPSSVHCQANRWLPALPVCLNADDSIRCPVVVAPGAIKRCEVMWGPEVGWTSCEQATPIGTRLAMDCREFYQRERGSSHITCLHDGTWSQAPLSCRPVCGVGSSSSTALIVRGWEASDAELFPWHATLFSHENGSWNFFCGGTLIAESVVLTAGHCVWKTDPSTVRVVLASRSSDFANRSEQSQVRDVERIELQDSYHDHEGNYGSDLALLILKEPASINARVLPACVDWSNEYDINRRAGEIGFISGMGVTENDTFSATLRLVSAQVVGDSECRARETRDFRKYLTYTSFCAGWANGTGVCNGDSGGGFLLRRPNSSLWDVHGIVSLSPRRLGANFCDPNYYTVFTRVSAYVDWIKDIVRSISVSEASKFHASFFPNTDNVEFD